jgi:hypothetical protein
MMPAAAAAPIDDSAAAGAALGVDLRAVATLQDRLAAPAAAADEPLEVWPDNALAVCLFDAMLTQWRGMGGGLDYAVLPGVAQSRGIAPRRAWRALPDLQVMEDEALLIFSESSKVEA